MGDDRIAMRRLEVVDPIRNRPEHRDDVLVARHRGVTSVFPLARAGRRPTAEIPSSAGKFPDEWGIFDA
jgi:hypothetical protein